MNLVKNTFLTHRQAGECEIFYKLFPFLHFTNANITAFYIPTGFKTNMSKYLRALSEEEGSNRKDAIEVDGRPDKLYIELENYYEKYLLRHPEVECISYIQFAQRYEPCKQRDIECNDAYWEGEFYGYTDKDGNAGCTTTDNDADADADADSDADTDIGSATDVNEDDFIYEYPPPERKKKLPRFIPYGQNGVKLMRLRAKRVIRFHKFNQTKNPHEFMYSELQKYVFHSDADHFSPDNFDSCADRFDQSLDHIISIKAKTMPYLDSVIVARERAEQFECDVGADLDANREQEDDMANDEGEHDNPDMAVKDPATSGALNDGPADVARSSGFRRIEVQDDGVLYAKLRNLDPEQRFVVDTAVQYARRLKMAFNQVGKNKFPEQLNLLVIGDGGTGKSHVIDVMSQLLHNTFKTSGDDPDQPYVLRLAFTGNAALLIRGQTLHSVFNLPFGNEIHSLTDQIRDLRRTQLQNLRVIIIDEISLVKSDFLYQIHFRLSRDIRQNNLPFGNVGVILCGDPLQIKPPQGSHVFQPPSNEKFNLEWSISPLWERFQPVILKTNHRHGNDRIYADICNRARVGRLTDEDKKLLKNRVFPKNSSMLPTDYLFASGTNQIVNEHNQKMLNGVDGHLYVFNAKVFGSGRRQIKPPLDSSGLIKNSPIPLKLELKVGARVSLTHNIDAVDGLVNGAM